VFTRCSSAPTVSSRHGLHPLPFTTFEEIAALGLELHVHCPSCHATRRLTIECQPWRDRRFATARFRCRAVSWRREICDSPGAVQVRPAKLLPIGGAVTLAFLFRRRCTWSIDRVQLDQPPWSTARMASGDRYCCPACGGRVNWHIHGPTWCPDYSENAAASKVP
jgi:hypothetical protein